MEPLDPGIEAQRGSAAFRTGVYARDTTDQQIDLLRQQLAHTQAQVDAMRLQIEADRALLDTIRRTIAGRTTAAAKDPYRHPRT